MTTLHRMRPALGPLLAGLVLGLCAYPGCAAWIVAALGQPAERPLSLADLAQLGLNHLWLAGGGFLIVGTLGTGLGILATRVFAKAARGAVDAAAALAQAVPPVVVVALALPVLGFGGPPTLLALLAYGLMPALRATIGAIEAVPPEPKDAARALGLTPLQILRKVELPLAFDGILDALRVALVLCVATAAVGALAGASTLGTPVVAGLQNLNTLPMLQGTAATAALAFLGEAVLLACAALLRQ